MGTACRQAAPVSSRRDAGLVGSRNGTGAGPSLRVASPLCESLREVRLFWVLRRAVDVFQSVVAEVVSLYALSMDECAFRQQELIGSMLMARAPTRD